MGQWTEYLAEAVLTGSLAVVVTTQTDPRYGTITHQTIEFQTDPEWADRRLPLMNRVSCKCDHVSAVHGICRAHGEAVHGVERSCSCPEVGSV